MNNVIQFEAKEQDRENVLKALVLGGESIRTAVDALEYVWLATEDLRDLVDAKSFAAMDATMQNAKDRLYALLDDGR